MDLEPSHIGMCPHCGKAAGKKCHATFNSVIGISASVLVEKQHNTIEMKTKPVKVLIVMIIIDVLILIVCTLIGLLAGNALMGFIVSLVAILIVDIWFKRKEKTIISEITKYQS